MVNYFTELDKPGLGYKFPDILEVGYPMMTGPIFSIREKKMNRRNRKLKDINGLNEVEQINDLNIDQNDCEIFETFN